MSEWIEAQRIAPGPNDRTTFTGLNDLAFSIQQNGLAQLPTLRPVGLSEDYLARYESLHGHRDVPDGLVFEIVAGERRTRAMVFVLQWDKIPCMVREMDDETAASIMLAENTAREDLNPIEEATAYHKRMTQYGWSVVEVAEKAGVGEQVVRNRVKLLELVEEIQHFIARGQFPISHALMLVGLDTNRQRIALKVYNQAKSMPAGRFQEIVEKLREDQARDDSATLFDVESYLVELVAQDADSPSGGKLAQTGAPTNPDLPPVRVNMADKVGAILDRHIADLLEAGCKAEAAAIGNLYNVLVSYKWTMVPANPCLDNKGAEPVGDGHSEII